MPAKTLSIENIEVPRFLYGTAWKEGETKRLTELALREGFRGIDTANQRRHYHEAAVGQAIAATIAGGVVSRKDLFLQTKFTFQSSHDHRLPYDPTAPVATQVEQSFASSLEHLQTEVIDSYLLHGPSRRTGLTGDDWATWRAMEAIHDSGRTRVLGISNVTSEQLEQLCQKARIRPSFVQNRCFAATGWDRRIRQFCTTTGIVYQGFSLLTANREVLPHPDLSVIARRHGRSTTQVIFRFALDIGMICLTGTTNAEHMRNDLDVADFRLSLEEVGRIEHLVAR